MHRSWITIQQQVNKVSELSALNCLQCDSAGLKSQRSTERAKGFSYDEGTNTHQWEKAEKNKQCHSKKSAHMQKFNGITASYCDPAQVRPSVGYAVMRNSRASLPIKWAVAKYCGLASMPEFGPSPILKLP